MLNQYTFDGYGKDLVNLIDDIQLGIILKIAKQLAKGKDLDDSAWSVLMLTQAVKLQRDISGIISKSVGKQQKEILAIKDRAIKAGLTDTDIQLARLGSVQSPDKFIAANIKVLDTVSSKLTTDLLSANLTMLNQSSLDYTKLVTDSLAKKELGNITRDQAVKQVLSDWSKSGIPALKDSLGRKWQPDVYVNMVVRTNSLQIAKQTQERRALDYGYDLILTSQHSDQSPEHAPYANKIYSLTGNDPNYPPFSVATSAGFMTRPNCRHTYSFYFKGDKPKTLTGTSKNYEASQQQRKIERRIRELKRQKVALEALGEDISLINQKIKGAQSDMRTFITESGRTRRPNREQA